MKTLIPVALVSAVLGGVIGGGLVQMLRAESGSDSKRPRAEQLRAAKPSDKGAEDEEENELASRLRTLEHRIGLVTAALQKQKDTGSLAAPAEAGVAPSERGDSTDVADPVFEAAVLDIVDRERERKDEEQAVWRKKLQAERGRRLANELTDSLQLNAQQEAEIAQAVTDYFEQMRALREDTSPNQPATRKEWREQRDRMNQASDDKLRQILSPEQFAKYEALSPDEKLGGGRRAPTRAVESSPR